MCGPCGHRNTESHFLELQTRKFSSDHGAAGRKSSCAECAVGRWSHDHEGGFRESPHAHGSRFTVQGFRVPSRWAGALDLSTPPIHTAHDPISEISWLFPRQDEQDQAIRVRSCIAGSAGAACVLHMRWVCPHFRVILQGGSVNSACDQGMHSPSRLTRSTLTHSQQSCAEG